MAKISTCKIITIICVVFAVAALILGLVFGLRSSDDEDVTTTVAPDVPTTQPDSPTTQPDSPTTQAPTTQAPTTQAPPTDSPAPTPIPNPDDPAPWADDVSCLPEYDEKKEITESEAQVECTNRGCNFVNGRCNFAENSFTRN